MGERFVTNPRQNDGLDVNTLGRAVDLRQFRHQSETLQGFIAGKGPKDIPAVSMQVDGRKEYWRLHEPGYQNRKLKVLSIGAHPDDTALSEGFEHVLVQQGRNGDKKETGLAVIMVTPGQGNGKPEERIDEDGRGTKRLEADAYVNLGFTDGITDKQKEQIKQRLAFYLLEFQPDIVILPDPNDKSHLDHVTVAEAAIDALLANKQRPIVTYTDHQFGDNKIAEGTVGFELTQSEHDVFTAAFLRDHSSQTNPMSEDVQIVAARPQERAAIYAPHLPYLGLVRQDLREAFSQVPISNHLGDRVVNIPFEDHVSSGEKVVSSPITVYEADRHPFFGSLSFTHVSQRRDLVAHPVLSAMDQSVGLDLDQFLVAEIDPDVAEGQAFFENYPVPEIGVAKCLVVRTYGRQERHAAIVVPSNSRADLNGAIRSELNARRVSLAPLDFAQQETGMEAGSMTALGLPSEWPILVDSSLEQQAKSGGILIGSGLRRSKLYFTGSFIDNIPNASAVHNLGIPA